VGHNSVRGKGFQDGGVRHSPEPGGSGGTDGGGSGASDRGGRASRRRNASPPAGGRSRSGTADGGSGGRATRRRGGAPAGNGGPRGPRGRTRGSRGAPKSSRRKALKWVAAVLSLLILGTAGAGYLYYEHLNSKLRREDLTLGKKMPDHKPNAAGQTPVNILVIGSDARNTKENQRLGGAKETFNATPLADVQMLVHLSADRSNISVINMPRDTMLPMPECKDSEGRVYPAREYAQTNESLGRGGPGCTVATWNNLTGITIDHFMMLDFAGVVSMADAVGGVPVCVDRNIRSRNSKGEGSGLELRKGETKVKGEQALQWLRTRYGFEDGSDLARNRAQRMYLNSMLRQLRKDAKLTDPNKLRKLAEAAISSLTVDDSIDSVKKLFDLGNALKDVPSDRITMTTLPNQYSERPGFRAKVEPKPGDAEQLFRMIRDDVPLDGKGSRKPAKPKAPAAPKDPAAAPAEIAVRVQNGTSGDGMAPETGRAKAVAGLLGGLGFTQAVADTTRNPQKQTVIRWSGADLEGDAQAVAKALGIPASQVRKADASHGGDGITLVVGSDWRLGDSYPKQAPVDDRTPESAEALSGDDEKACMKVNPAFSF
jgi:LCP family protein required for cell wall assembly